MRRPSPLARIACAAARFARSSSGAVSVETVVILPMLIGTLLAMAAMWDGFRAKNAALKAATTISDAISRETAPIDADYIARMEALYAFLAGARGETTLRVSVVANTMGDDGEEELELRWSAVSDGSMSPATDAAELSDHVPAIAVGDQIIVVESRTAWTPPVQAQIIAQTFEEVTVARARFVPQVLWSDE